MGNFIESVAIADNRYAVSDPSICLYNYGGCEGLTLGQLVNAICCHAGDALETQSITKMNLITRRSRHLKGFANTLEGLVDGSLTYDSVFDYEGYGAMRVRDFLVNVCGLVISATTAGAEEGGDLPPSTATTNDRLMVYTAMKEKLDSMTTESQQDMIDLQMYMSRRDVCFSTATNVVRTLGQALQMTASNY